MHEHLKLLQKRHKEVYLKTILTEQNKILRIKYALSQINRSHGRKKLRIEDNKCTIIVDERWFYLTSDAITVILIEDMDVLIHPKGHRKSHLNINGLGFFASLKVDVKQICTHCTSRVGMMINAVKAFDGCPSIWACWFNNLRSVVSFDDGNDYK